MQTRSITVKVEGSPMRVYLAAPDGPGPFPAVVVDHGLGGPEEVIQELTRRVAGAGFVAAAPDYYHRQQDNILEEVKGLVPGSPERVQRLRAKMDQLRDDEIIADGRAVLTHLRGLPNVAGERIGVTGFCMGGRVTYLLATAIPDFTAAAPFYPAGLWSAWGSGPSPFARTEGIACPLLGIFGGEDKNPSPEDVAKLDAELTRRGKQHEFHTFPGAGHDFQNFKSNSYHEQAAEASWPLLIAFLRRHLSPAVARP